MIRSTPPSYSFIPQTWGWSEIPPDMFQVDICDQLKFREVVKLTEVCKNWRIMIMDNKTGAKRLENVFIGVIGKDRWISLYREYIETPHVIALDVSPSMRYNVVPPKLKCEEIALNIIRNLVNKLEPFIMFRGIDCIVFTDTPVKTKCYTPAGVIDFFTHGYKHPRFFKHIKGGGTDINNLFYDLKHIQKKYEKIKPDIIGVYTIISDFGDTMMTVDPLIISNPKMHIQLVNVGDDDGGRNLRKISQKYEEWVSIHVQNQYVDEVDRAILTKQKAAQWKTECIQMCLEKREKIKKMRVISGSKSATKQHRPNSRFPKRDKFVLIDTRNHAREVAPQREFGVSLSLTCVDSDNWTPTQKKRKMTIDPSVEPKPKKRRISSLGNQKIIYGEPE